MSIAEDVKIGKNTKIYHPETVNLYGCTIGDDCIVGAFVEIRKGVKVGNRVKIQAFAFIPEGVSLEDEVFIGPGVVFTNDNFPRATNQDGGLKVSKDWKIVQTKVCKKASIGANSTVLGGVTIKMGAMVGAGSVVTKDVPPWTIVAGNPAKVIRRIK
ncbi:acetyltransferase [Candidatus Daviesbacteria bacterium RIFCSPLOWO2_01_FULL_39_12]|uniref:Acetyltransferase n=1 Tax=Candidatus Daviesbacteria bacterium RIFCSPLOWO2_01_FULL_39_12 TaxID=1797785 RepID=A0A1F5KNX9_9BACT|nr:MAG: acetyltransferase [Candidatus Daviesbacteria bacterium RIFCSPHIGHO2_02_FULL_39_8]OGE42657.1 MAG: acetyltransferase [Candidatus Daviesbacteria bacterium RIFCSPLOWO2_01_FULL_39_12]